MIMARLEAYKRDIIDALLSVLDAMLIELLAHHIFSFWCQAQGPKRIG